MKTESACRCIYCSRLCDYAGNLLDQNMPGVPQEPDYGICSMCAVNNPLSSRELTPQERIAACRRIIERRQYEVIERSLIDLQTAHAIITVYDALSPENREIFAAKPVYTMGVIAWHLVR